MDFMHLKKAIAFIFTSTVLSATVFGQSNSISRDSLLGQINTITTAVPFLLIAPDARAGSMGDAGYVVRGRGVSEALESASHGAGRLMSRTAALNSISRATRDEYLKERGVTLLGGGIDESPQAYKPIDSVMAAQHDLVDVIGKFTPRIVRMADEPGDI